MDKHSFLAIQINRWILLELLQSKKEGGGRQTKKLI